MEVVLNIVRGVVLFGICVINIDLYNSVKNAASLFKSNVVLATARMKVKRHNDTV